jgi:hypothetical protein
MKLTFEQDEDSQGITSQELTDFETFIRHTLPADYIQHMLTHNGSMVMEDVRHINFPEGGGGISYFYPIKYGGDTMEMVYADFNGVIPNGYLCIGKTTTGGHIIMSLNSGPTYGNTKEWFSDGDMFDLSSTFGQLLNDMVEE